MPKEEGELVVDDLCSQTNRIEDCIYREYRRWLPDNSTQSGIRCLTFVVIYAL
jgi:hypothetical protein